MPVNSWCTNPTMGVSTDKTWADVLLAKYTELKKIRESKTLKLNPSPLLKSEIVVDGETVPFNFRYYQSIGVYHMLVMDRMVLGDATGIGKTIEIIGTFAYLWLKEPDNKAIVVTPKSALWQWASEIERFMVGVRPIVASGSPENRKKAYEEFVNAPIGPGHPKVVLLLNYALLIRDWDAGGFRPTNAKGKPDPYQPVQPGLLDSLTSKIPNLWVVFDEAATFKNQRTKTWQICKFLSEKAIRVYGLTATPLKNDLIEGFAIFKVIQPKIFTTVSKFMDSYCKVHLQSVPGTRRKIPIIVGYKNLEDFRNRIDPFYLGRAKHEVSSELPQLITKEVVCELTPAELSKYDEALTGLLELGDGEIKDYQESKAMASLIYCQEIVNSLHLLKFEDIKSSAKESMLLDLLENELSQERVIIYTRFEKFVTRMTTLLTDAGIKSVRITGKEDDKPRKHAQETFQNHQSDTKVIFITDAGSEAINLQAASAMIFMDAPWSWGNYVQLLGRPIRIGSKHQNVVVYHLVAVRPGKTDKQRRTIDHHVLEMLRSKKDFVTSILGESAVGALDFQKEKKSSRDLIDRMKNDIVVKGKNVQ